MKSILKIEVYQINLMKNLEKMGLDKGLVDGYIAGQEAIANNEVKQFTIWLVVNKIMQK